MMQYRQKLLILILGLFFIATRWYIWERGPVEFSQITAVYMPYAHLWAEGTKPYLQQWYEYPPATIPLFYLPHVIDMATLNYGWHINYGQAYRGIILIVDIALFCLIIITLKKFKVKPAVMAGAIVYYSLATAKAHDFVYDAMDLVFIGAVSLGVMAPFLIKHFGGRLVGWLAYFLAVGLKLINAPLGIVYAVFERKNRRKLIINVVLAGLLMWGIPLIVYRSSLSVMLVYHSARGLQVESVPAQIAATINRFTHTEKYEELYQSVNITGPISDQLTHIFNWLLILGVGGYIFWASRMAWRMPGPNRAQARLLLTSGYFFTFMLFAKVLSTPYLLWQMPLLALYPYKSLKQQLMFTIPSMAMIAISMTAIPNLALGIFDLHLAIGWTRSILIAYLLWQSVRLNRELVRNKAV